MFCCPHTCIPEVHESSLFHLLVYINQCPQGCYDTATSVSPMRKVCLDLQYIVQNYTLYYRLHKPAERRRAVPIFKPSLCITSSKILQGNKFMYMYVHDLTYIVGIPSCIKIKDIVSNILLFTLVWSYPLMFGMWVELMMTSKL